MTKARGDILRKKRDTTQVQIKPWTSQLNGGVERSHQTEKQEFYQVLTYKNDVDLKKKLAYRILRK